MKNFEIKSHFGSYSVSIAKSFKEFSNVFNNSTRYVFIVDESVKNESLDNVLAKYKETVFYVKAGEGLKNLSSYEQMIEKLLKQNVFKSDVLVAIGGGSVLDFVGYVAGTFKRGLSYISFPTTTLGMVDASIGGKTALNAGTVKNAIGLIYPPKAVYVCLEFLKTLDERNFNNGLFEAVKTGLIGDASLFDIFFKGTEKENLEEVIEKSLLVKKNLIEADEFDLNERRKLNFGHTYGHAIELKSNLLHGEAIANGMLKMAEGKTYYNELKKILTRLNCPLISFTDFDIRNDKKADISSIYEVFVEEVGKAEIRKVSIKEMEECK